ncbi:MAG: copper amine oxidase N-terminal domain-containing protein, partial [Defluviitaleaceae bacterium]|nr:copper amine oxidase N-terminal domain-containing protein [Defluviitaleaceae bacterium]
ELLRVPIDSPTVYRSIRQNNGMYTNLREVEMDTAAWIAAETGSTMIPIRFVSYLLDLPVLWREEESTAIIDPYGMDLRITANSPYMYRNGERLPILNVDGEQVYSVIKDNRLFIPLRGTGTALGLRPAWSPNVAMLYIE